MRNAVRDMDLVAEALPVGLTRALSDPDADPEAVAESECERLALLNDPDGLRVPLPDCVAVGARVRLVVTDPDTDREPVRLGDVERVWDGDRVSEGVVVGDEDMECEAL